MNRLAGLYRERTVFVRSNHGWHSWRLGTISAIALGGVGREETCPKIDSFFASLHGTNDMGHRLPRLRSGHDHLTLLFASETENVTRFVGRSPVP